MRVVIAGSRAVVKEELVHTILDWHLEEWKGETLEFCSGGADGVDSIAQKYLESLGYDFTLFLADWDTIGKGAGFVRNETMVMWAQNSIYSTLIAIIKGKSKGTRHTIKRALDLGVDDVYVHRIR